MEVENRSRTTLSYYLSNLHHLDDAEDVADVRGDLDDDDDSDEARNPGVARFSHWMRCTSMHGVKFLLASVTRNPLKRLMWFCLIFAVLFVATVFLAEAIEGYYFGNQKVTVELSSGAAAPGLLTFPAVTICSVNKVRSSAIRELFPYVEDASVMEQLWEDLLRVAYIGIGPGADGDDYQVPPERLQRVHATFTDEGLVRQGLLYKAMRDEAIDVGQASSLPRPPLREILSAQNSSFARSGGYFKIVAHQSLDESHVVQVGFQGKTRVGGHVNTEFKAFAGSPDDGLCYTVHPTLSFDQRFAREPYGEKYRLPLGQVQRGADGVKLGLSQGLSVLLDRKGYEHAVSFREGDGFTVNIHHLNDKPLISVPDAVLAPGVHTKLNVVAVAAKIEAAALLGGCGSSCRGCRTEEENLPGRILAGQFRYSLRNCLLEASLRRVLDECGCLPHVFFDTVSFNESAAVPEVRQQRVDEFCWGESLHCLAAVLDEAPLAIAAAGGASPCLPPCQDLDYELEESSSGIAPMNHGFEDHADILCPVGLALIARCLKGGPPTLLDPELCKLLLTPAEPVPDQDDGAAPAATGGQEEQRPRLLLAEACRLLAAASEDRGEDPPEGGPTLGPAGWDPETELQFEAMFDPVFWEAGSDRNGTAATAPVRLEAIKAALSRYVADNVSKVTVFFTETAAVGYVRDRRTPLIWFIATLGGVMGITLGMSLTTFGEFLEALFETVALCGVKLFNDFKRRREAKKSGYKRRAFRQVLGENLNKV